MAKYQVENQWGGDEAPWHDGGVWELGNREDQIIEAISCKADGSDELDGDMTYSGEGPIGLKLAYETLPEPNQYAAENQWGGDDAPWHPAGTWTVGCRPEQRVVQLDAKASGSDGDLVGTMTYAGEGAIGFKASIIKGN